MRFLAVVTLMAIAVVSALGAPRSTAPLPPSAVLFDGDYSFRTIGTTFSTPVTVPVDGAWLAGTAVWNHTSYPYWDCSHSYRGVLAPNNNDYSPLFIAGWDANSICSDQFPVFGCLNCGVDWGGQKAFPGFYMTTNNTPGFIAPGTGAVTLSSNNSGGQSDLLTLHVEQINRDSMVNLTIYQSLDENDPTPASSTEIADRYFIAESADRVPVVPVFHYGVDAQGTDRQFPAGPDVTYVAAWDRGTPTSTPEIAFAQQGLHGHTILAVPIPKLATGSHTFTITATLPSGRTFTTPSMTVFVYAKSIYITVNAAFDPRNPQDDLPNFIPGSDLNGVDLDLRSGPQSVQLNILISRGSSGTFDVHLRDVTHYPGVAMNFPIGAPNPDPDPDIDFGSGIVDLMAVPIPHGGSPKVVRLPLYIHDYAAAATIEATIPHRRTTFVTRRRIPQDNNGNGLPDAGWYAFGLHVDDAGLTAARDDDAPAGSVGTDAAVTGDGLSSLEELRGFFVGGSHIRLDPREKEIFVDVDPEFLLAGSAASPVPKLATLTPRILYLQPNEVSGQDLLSRNLLRTQGVVDPNRATVPVAHARPQRAVRLIYQSNLPPAFHLAGPNIDVPVWQIGYLGATFSDDILSIDVVNAPGNVATTQTPMRTQFSEVYPRTWTNLAVNTTFSYPFHYDANGNVVPRCAFQGESGCDYWDTTNLLIIPSLQNNAWGILYTVPDPAHDPVEHYSLQARNCGSDTAVLGGLTTVQMEQLKGLIAAHEIGHAMDMEHLRDFATQCGDMMFDDEAMPPHRRAMSNYVPQPSGFSAMDQAMIRLWQP